MKSTTCTIFSFGIYARFRPICGRHSLIMTHTKMHILQLLFLCKLNTTEAVLCYTQAVYAHWIAKLFISNTYTSELTSHTAHLYLSSYITTVIVTVASKCQKSNYVSVLYSRQIRMSLCYVSTWLCPTLPTSCLGYKSEWSKQFKGN